ncbi:MAG: cyclic nucleotide-binding domain-containing protein, partial [Desulfatitalea sp.]|nr:cyclic nucleotide-binding domain-containing protein [Desulfatitalea sp.]
ASIKPFSILPKSEIEQIARHLTAMTYPEGTVLATQGQTRLAGLYILKTGVLEAFFEEGGKKVLTLSLRPGDVYGGISILMNAGLSIRTVQVREAASFYLLPAEHFSNVCAAHKAFREHFVDAFAKRMADEAYAGRVTEGQAVAFLSNVAPFSFLPDDVIEATAGHLSMLLYPRDRFMLYQGVSKVDQLYIIQKGAAEIFYEEAGRKTMAALLGEGDIYGGISLLMNEGKSVRTVRTVEDCYFFTLPAAVFLELCQQNEVLTEYFTDIFGKRMLDRTYASIIARSLHPGEDGAQLFDQPVRQFIVKQPVVCEDAATIQQAAARMSRNRCSSILVRNTSGQHVGLITDHDLRNKVVAQGHDVGRPVTDIMSSPLQTISAQQLVFEALMAMTQANVKHLAVTDAGGQVVGVITNRDLINAQTRSPLFLVREIMSARHPDDILDKSAQLARLIQDLMHSGAKAKNITRMITTVSDAILHRIADFVLKEMDPPPVPFAFMVLGSEGRREQTLKTDQDNAIIFEDIADKADLERATAYFLKFGKRVCGLLDRAGYDYCKGGVMAQNPRWCQPLSVWKHYFKTWIHTADPKDLLDASIFFDLRGGFGQMHLIGELRQYLSDALTGWSGFFRHLAENALHFKPPLGFFRNFVVESKGENRNALDLKSAVMPIVDIARIYALKHRVEATNTMERLGQLQQIGVFTEETVNELELAYGFLMQMRFSRQVTAMVTDNEPPDNYINPKQLPPVERTMLKEIFKRIEKYQARLSFDFTGAP